MPFSCQVSSSHHIPGDYQGESDLNSYEYEREQSCDFETETKNEECRILDPQLLFDNNIELDKCVECYEQELVECCEQKTKFYSGCTSVSTQQWTRWAIAQKCPAQGLLVKARTTVILSPT